MRFEERGVHLARPPHGEGSEHQVAAGNPFECPEIRAAGLRDLLEAAQGLIKPFPGVALPVVPAVPDQIFRLGHIEPIAEFGMIADPPPVFLECFPDLSYRYGNSMPGNGDA